MHFTGTPMQFQDRLWKWFRWRILRYLYLHFRKYFHIWIPSHFSFLKFCLNFASFYGKRLMHIWASLLRLGWHQWRAQPLEEGNGKRHLTTWCRPYLRKSIRWIPTTSCCPFVLKLLLIFIFHLKQVFWF